MSAGETLKANSKGAKISEGKKGENVQLQEETGGNGAEMLTPNLTGNLDLVKKMRLAAKVSNKAARVSKSSVKASQKSAKTTKKTVEMRLTKARMLKRARMPMSRTMTSKTKEMTTRRIPIVSLQTPSEIA